MAPAHCTILDGLFFGIVIKIGSATLYCQSQKKGEEEGNQPAVGYKQCIYK